MGKYYANSCGQRSCKQEKSPKLRFYDQLRTFFIFNIVMSVLMISGSGFGGMWRISLFWGLFLFIRYLKIFGWPSNGWFGQDWQEWMQQREGQKPSDRPTRNPTDDRPDWRDKDLV